MISRKIARNEENSGRSHKGHDLSGHKNRPSRAIKNPVHLHKNILEVNGQNLKTVVLDELISIDAGNNKKVVVVKTDKESSNITDDNVNGVINNISIEATRVAKSGHHIENIVQASARGLSDLGMALDEYKSNLRARGIRLQTSNVMLELAIQDKSDELGKMASSAVQASRKKYGDGAITREELDTLLDSMVALEKDIQNERKLCKENGLNIQALNILTQLMRQNPGDCGEKVINTLFGYAVSCEIELTGIDAIKQKYAAEKISVLPNVVRKNVDEKSTNMRNIITDVFIGLFLTVALMALLV